MTILLQSIQSSKHLLVRRSTRSSINELSKKVIIPLSSPSSSISFFSSTSTTNDQSSSHQPPSVTLYQYQICPFCNINKALLSYTNTPYTQTEVNPLTKTEVKSLPTNKENDQGKKYTKVPIAMINDEQYNGSNDINDILLKNDYVQNMLHSKWTNYDQGNTSMTMEQFHDSKESQKWIQFAKDELAPILYPNICRSLSESYHAFDYIHSIEKYTFVQKYMIQYVGSLAMYFAASKIKSKRNIVDERKALKEALNKFENEGLDSGSKQFTSGLDVPNLGDVAMFGVLNSVSGFVDEKEIVSSDSGVVKEWYDRMKNEVITAT